MFCVILQRLENEKEELERDLSFKADQALQYDKLLETVREHNRQLQVGGSTKKPKCYNNTMMCYIFCCWIFIVFLSQMSLKESNNAQRSLENQLMTFQSKDPGKDYQIKELEGSRRALEQENELLRKKVGDVLP